MAIRTSPTVDRTDAFVDGRRIPGRSPYGGGPDVVAGDWALSAGFGTTASVAVAAGSKATSGQITITSAGTGQGANPTATLTFPGGTFGTAPARAGARRNGGSQATVAVDVTTVNATTIVLTFRGTPVAAETYTIDYVVQPATDTY